MNSEENTPATGPEAPPAGATFGAATDANDAADRLDGGVQAGQSAGADGVAETATDPHNSDMPRAGVRDAVVIPEGATHVEITTYERGGSGAAVRDDALAFNRVSIDLVDNARSSSAQDPVRQQARECLATLRDIEEQLSDLETRKAMTRDMLKSTLEGMEDQSITTPYGQASISDAPRRVKITGTVPLDFMKTVPDEKKIGDALRAGNVVAGAELGNGGETQLRVIWPKKTS